MIDDGLPQIRKRSLIAAAASCLALPSIGYAAMDDPLAISNRNPFVEVYGLPTAQNARLVGADQLRVALQLDLANSFSRNDSGAEAVVIDGETLRSNLQLRYGLADRWELGLEVPYLRHEGGSLDGFIDGWHNFWGLPDGGRPGTAKDQLQYAYRQTGVSQFSLADSVQGPGDVSLSLGYQLSDDPLQQWALRGTIKLPSGDADKLLGSESTDLSLGLQLSDQHLADEYRLRWHASAGLLWMDGGEVLNQLRKDWVAFGSATLSWQYSESVNLKLQLDAHSAFYDSALTELGSDAAQLTAGGTVKLGDSWLLDLALVEDIAVDTSPDIVFHMAIKAVGW